ncbi:MAG: hypothetical protein WAK13_05780 [Terriglobales bacterium]
MKNLTRTVATGSKTILQAVLAAVLAATIGAVIGAPIGEGNARAQERAPNPPVTVLEVWQAVASELRSRGLREDELPRTEDLELPVAVPARAGRSLHVSSVCWDADALKARLRMQCSAAGDCLPFLVYLGGAGHLAAASCRREGRERAPTPRKSEATIESGERATAVWVMPSLRMTAEVICLERGARGDIVRVRGVEGHIFRARVAGRGLVEALPE